MKRWFVIIACLFAPSVLLADTLQVDGVEYTTIQSAIDDANHGDIIVVEPGIYYETIDFLGKAVTVRSNDPNDPNIVEDTIIDANNPVDPNFGSAVIFRSGETNASILEGFTIQNGTGSWILVSWEYNGLHWNRCGGGVLCYNMSAPTIRNNTFNNNSAGQGGGIYIYGDPVNPNNPENPGIHISPVVKNNIFINNTAIQEHGFEPPDTVYPENDHGDGGAFVGFQGVDAIIKNNLFEENIADLYGGAMHLRQWCHGIIQDNHITDNESTLGAGLHITYFSSPLISDNLIESNQAGSLGGGGIYIYNRSEPNVIKNTIRYNRSSRGAGIGVFYDSDPVISNNLIVKNNTGAGILCVDSSPDIAHNTIAHNTPNFYSGGIHLEASSPLISHNIITSNGEGKGIRVYGTEPSSPLIRYNNIWGHPNGNYDGYLGDQTGINGNLSLNPEFIDAQTNDYHLSMDSGCINIGDPNEAFPQETDFDGDTRIMGSTTDIGADEVWPVQNINSNENYLTIQQAINDSNDSDTVVVVPDVYYERINYYSKNIILRSTDPNNWEIVERTIIDANDNGTAVIIYGNQDSSSALMGFTIRDGNSLLGDQTDGHAGGILCYASPRIQHNIITSNYAAYKGGGLYCWSSNANPLLNNNKIISNSAWYGGGVFADTSSNPTVTHNYIADNVSERGGGGIVCSYNPEPIVIEYNQIFGNSALDGAGIHAGSSSPRICNNLICGNRAESTGGGITVTSGSKASIINNTIVCNAAGNGGGIACKYKDTDPNIFNNIIAFSEQGEGIYCIDHPMIPNSVPDPNVFFNDVFGNAAGNYGGLIDDLTDVNSNISIDPNLVSTGYFTDTNEFIPGNYHLMLISACINTADANRLPETLQYDIDFEIRIFEDKLDIGADELVKNEYDLNTDGIVDPCELQILSNEWLTNTPPLQTDFYNDGFIDFLDLAALAEQWLWKGGWYE